MPRVQPLHDRLHQRFGACAIDRADRERRSIPTQSCHDLGHPRRALLRRQQVQLVEHQPTLAFSQFSTVLGQLGQDHRDIVHRVAAVTVGGNIDQMQQQPGARQVAQKLNAQPGAFGSALDQAGNIGHHKALQRSDPHYAQIRMQGRERIVGDLGPGRRYGANQSRFARIGHAEQADIGKHLQLQAQVARLAGGAGLGLPRGAIGAAFVAGVAKAVETALRDPQTLAGGDQVADQFAGVGVVGQGADWNDDFQISAAAAGAVGAHTVLATLSAKTPRVAVIDQSIEFRVGAQVNAAPVAAIAPVGATKRDVFLAAEADTAVAAIAGLDADDHFIDKFHGVLRGPWTKKSPKRGF